MSVVKPTSQITAAHDVTSATNVQFTGPSSQSVNNKSLPSLTDTAHFQDQDSDVDPYSEPTSLLSPLRERVRYLTQQGLPENG